MDFSTRLRRWLSRHPLREPSERHMSRYTAEVMGKVKALEHPAASTALLHPWLAWPRLALACATAAGLALVVWLSQDAPSRLLAGLNDEAVLELYADGDLDDLSAELETDDLLMLAEVPQDDASWVEQTLQLLDELGEEAPDEGTAGGSSDQDWLDELELLDESDLSAPS